MNALKSSLLILLLLAPGMLLAKARVAKIGKLESVGAHSRFFVEYTGDLNSIPQVMIRQNIVQLQMDEVVVWPKIEKKINMGDRPFDGTLMAYQFNKDTARFRIVAPDDFVYKQEEVKVTFKKNKIYVDLPRRNKTASVAPGPTRKKSTLARKQANKKTSEKDLSFESADEELLEKILKSDEEIAKSIARDIGNTGQDKVNTIQSAGKAVVSKKENKFSLMNYVGKFVAFLALVLALFYGLIALFKKGVFKKSKLGLLGKSNPVTVLSTTYLGPKRTLLTVKVHDKVLLLASSENGINFLSEIEAGTQVLKNGEKEIAGDNFDSNLSEVVAQEKSFQLKEDIKQFAKNEKSKKSNIADQIKDKVKGLKSLQ